MLQPRISIDPLFRRHRATWWAGLCLVAALSAGPAAAQEHGSTPIPRNATPPPGFLENRGQVRNQHGLPRPDVDFLFVAPGFRMQLRKDGFSYEWLRRIPASGSVSEATGTAATADGRARAALLSSSRVDVAYAGNTGAARFRAAGAADDETRYYMAGLPERGIGGVRRFRTVTCENVWPGIDIVFTALDAPGEGGGPGIEYSFLVHPGARTEDIRLRYSGMANPQLAADGALRIAVANGSLLERLPLSYELPLTASDGHAAALKREGIAPALPVAALRREAAFRVEGDAVSVAVNGPRGDGLLVIDPTVQWSTYYGGAGDDKITGVGTDPNNNIIVTGTTSSTGNIASNGAYQQALAGGTDAFVLKFSSTGARQWATYFGGDADERSSKVRVVGLNTIVAVGTTASTGGISTTGAFQPGLTGGTDGYIAKFDGSGARNWSTYIGSFNDEELHGLAMNSGGQIAICGSTSSTYGIASAGAHQTVYAGGTHDGFVSLFSPVGSRTWSTFYGGSGDDVCYGVTFDTTGAVAVIGYSTSSSGIALGGQQNVIGGAGDAFIALINAMCVRQWSTYLGGADDDAGLSIARAPGGHFYAAGYTLSSAGIATPGAYQSGQQGALDGFLSRYSNTGVLQWSTYVGGGDNDIIYDIATDANADIFLAGWSTSNGGLSTPGSHQVANGGSGDAFIDKFSSGGSMVWGSYFGGSSEDQGLGVAVDGSGAPVLVGVTASSSDIASTGAFQPNLGGGASDGFVTKFFGGASGHSIVTNITPDTLCAGDPITIPYTALGIYNVNNTFFAELSNALGSFSFPLVLGQIAATGSGVISGVVPTYVPDGTHYRIRITSSSPAIVGSDNGRDIVIRSIPDTAINVTGATTFCAGDSVMLCAAYRPEYTYRWMRNGVTISGETGACYSAHDSGAYAVEIRNFSRCPASTRAVQVRLVAGPKVTVAAVRPPSICEGDTLTLTSRSTPAGSVQWQRDGFDIAGATTESITITMAGAYRAFALGANGCRAGSDTVLVTVRPLPDANVTPAGPIVLCRGDSVKLAATAGAASYQWLRDGIPVSGATAPNYHAKQSGQYQVLVTGANGCSLLSRIIGITLDPLPESIITPPGPHTICGGEVQLLNGPAGCNCKMQWYRNGVLLSGETFPSLAVRTSGSYTLLLTGTSGCSSLSAPVLVNVKPAPANSLTAVRTQACIGDSIRLDVAASPTATLTWQKDGADIAGATGRSRMVRESGTYTVFARDTNGCTSTSQQVSLRFVGYPSVTLTQEGKTPLCEGDSLVLRAKYDAEVRYYWMRNGQHLPLDTTEALVTRAAGIYQLIATHIVGCADTSLPVAVVVNPRPAAALSGSSTVCLNSRSVYRVATGAGLRIQWSVQGGSPDAPLNRDSVSVRWLTSGNGRVLVTVTDTISGCAVSASMNVSVGSSLQPTMTLSRPTPLCQGDSVLLDAGPGYSTYRWNTTETTRSIVVRSAGSYSVAVTDASGCSGQSTPVLIRVNPTPAPTVAVFGSTQLCEGDSAVLDAGAWARYRWSNGDSARFITVKTAGAYSVAVADSAGCEGSSSPVDVQMSLKPQPVLTVLGQTNFCEGDSAVLSVQAGFASYKWSDGSAGRTIVAKASGRYWAMVSNAGGCTATTDSIDITVHAVPVARITGPTSLCINSEGLFTVPVEPGGSYVWRSANGTVVSGAGTNELRMRWSVTGSDTVTVLVTGQGGCSATARMPVEIATRLHPAISPSGVVTLCKGDTLLLSAQPGYASYLWSTGDTTMSITVSATGRYSIHVRDAGGCEGESDTVEVFVTQAAVPAIALGGPATLCEGDSVTADAGAGYRSYAWSNGFTGRRQTLRSDVLLTVDVTDSNGCKASSQPVRISVTPRPRPSIAASGALEFCEGDSVVLSVGAYSAVHWSNGAGTAAIVVKSTGRYAASVDSANGCSGGTDTVVVLVHPRPAIPVIVQAGDSLFAPAAAAHRWFRNDTLQTGFTGLLYPNPPDGVYRVEVASAFGCTAMSTPFTVRSSASMSSVVSLSDITASPGERIALPLLLVSTQNVTRGGAAYSATIAFNRNLFLPIGTAYRDSAGLRLVDVSGGDASRSDSLALIEGMVMLGDSVSTALRVSRFQWSDGRIAVSAIPGTLRVRVCEEGGSRLFDGGVRFQIAQNRPNPFNASTVIDVDLIEQGWTEVRISDPLGRELRTLFAGNAEPGRRSFRFDAEDLPSGMYFCVVLTPSARAFRIMELVK